jgi:hypothetical protein
LGQEITHSFSLSSWHQKAFLLKIDLAKAFDRMEWDFILHALIKQGFSEHITKLIKTCISTASFSIIINGQLHGKFKSGRGIRQGCPLSPYLFVIAINELAASLQDHLDSQSLKGITLGPNCPAIHSFMFADDLVVCGQADAEDALIIRDAINTFCRASGQTPNWEKSSVLFSKHVTHQQKVFIKSLFPVQSMDNTSVHLGHPLIMPAKNRNEAYSFVLDKFKAKLSTYKANKLSHAARLVLIKSVFSSIPVYYMTNIMFSKKLLPQIRGVIRDFWWTGVQDENATKPLYLKAWTEICKPTREGGLGIRDLEAVNKALLVNAAWRIVVNTEETTSKVLKSKYFPNTSFWRSPVSVPKSAFSSSILKVKDCLINSCILQISKGNSNIRNSPWCPFWKNIHDHLIIQDQGFVYPSTISDLWLPNTHTWTISLIAQLFGRNNAQIIAEIPIDPTGDGDTLIWKHTPSGICSTKSAFQKFKPPHPMNTNMQNDHCVRYYFNGFCLSSLPQITR